MNYISICIPAYKRPENIDRLLQSISLQSFKDYEIIITDDSMDDSLQPVLQKYSYLPILYFKNEQALGTPANWNYGISKASGEWIKLMHDDDWFSSAESLEKFAAHTKSGTKFIFSAYKNITAGTGTQISMLFPDSWNKRIIKEPVTLLSNNVIGPPSVTLVHHSITEKYDERMKWRVDLDFYIRVLKLEKQYNYINDQLVNVGVNNTQVTNYCINQPEVELPEGLLLLKKYGVQPLKNLRVYDAWWRIIRNLGIRNTNQLQQYTKVEEWPKVIINIIRQQSVITPKMLRIGAFSKFLMSLSFIRNQKYLNNYH